MLKCWFLFYELIYYGIFGRYNGHSMLALLKSIMNFLSTIKTKQIFLTKMLAFMVSSNSSVTAVYNDVIDDIQYQLLLTS